MTQESTPAGSSVVIDNPWTQQWRLLASRGHQLLAQVDVLRYRSTRAFVIGGLALLSIPAVLYVTPKIGDAVGRGAGAVAGAGSSISQKVANFFVRAGDAVTADSDIKSTPAPKVSPIRYIEGKGENDPAQILNTDQVREKMLAWSKLLEAGKDIPAAECDSSKKIIEPWFGNNDVRLRCRASADKTRLWVWGYAFASPDVQRRTGPVEVSGGVDAVSLAMAAMRGSDQSGGRPGNKGPEGGGFAALLYKAGGHPWTISQVRVEGGDLVYVYLDDMVEAAAKAATERVKIDETSVATKTSSAKRQAIAVYAERERFAVKLDRIPRSIIADLPELQATEEPAAVKLGTQSGTAPQIYTAPRVFFGR